MTQLRIWRLAHLPASARRGPRHDEMVWLFCTATMVEPISWLGRRLAGCARHAQADQGRGLAFDRAPEPTMKLLAQSRAVVPRISKIPRPR